MLDRKFGSWSEEQEKFSEAKSRDSAAVSEAAHETRNFQD